MTRNNSDNQLIEQINQSLDQQVDALDTVTLSRLYQARIHALEEMERKHKKNTQPSTLWMGGFATMATLAVMLIFIWPDSDGLLPEFTQEIGDITLLSDDNSIDFYEDLDFYIWLEQKEFNTSEVS